MKSFKLQILIIISVLGLILFSGCSKRAEAPKVEARPIPVAVDTVALQSFQIDYHSIGRVVSETQVNLLFQSAGQVDSVWVEVGDHVAQDQRLASIKTDVYQTMFTQAHSMFEKAKRDLESSRSLFESKVISSDQYELARIGLDNARAAYTQAKNTLDNAILTAPFDGWIVAKNLNVGELVAPGAAMQPPLVLADMAHLKIIVPVPEARIGQIEVGQQAQVSFKTFADRIFKGQVLRVGLAPKDFSNNYDVEVRLNGDVSGLKLGLIADVHIVLKYYDQALVLPLNLIQDDGKSQFVFTTKAGLAVRKDIVVEALTGSQALITAEIEPGDILVVKGEHDLKDGSRLDIVE